MVWFNRTRARVYIFAQAKLTAYVNPGQFYGALFESKQKSFKIYF